jgi:hypothetical protein
LWESVATNNNNVLRTMPYLQYLCCHFSVTQAPKFFRVDRKELSIVHWAYSLKTWNSQSIQAANKQTCTWVFGINYYYPRPLGPADWQQNGMLLDLRFVPGAKSELNTISLAPQSIVRKYTAISGLLACKHSNKQLKAKGSRVPMGS